MLLEGVRATASPPSPLSPPPSLPSPPSPSPSSLPLPPSCSPSCSPFSCIVYASTLEYRLPEPTAAAACCITATAAAARGTRGRELDLAPPSPSWIVPPELGVAGVAWLGLGLG